jgi:hypothetical protein
MTTTRRWTRTQLFALVAAAGLVAVFVLNLAAAVGSSCCNSDSPSAGELARPSVSIRSTAPLLVSAGVQSTAYPPPVPPTSQPLNPELKVDRFGRFPSPSGVLDEPVPLNALPYGKLLGDLQSRLDARDAGGLAARLGEDHDGDGGTDALLYGVGMWEGGDTWAPARVNAALETMFAAGSRPVVQGYFAAGPVAELVGFDGCVGVVTCCWTGGVAFSTPDPAPGYGEALPEELPSGAFGWTLCQGLPDDWRWNEWLWSESSGPTSERPAAPMQAAATSYSDLVAGWAERDWPQPVVYHPIDRAASEPREGLGEGRHPALLEGVDEVGRTVTLDPILWFVGEAANLAAAQDAVALPPSDDAPAYGRNDQVETATLPVDPHAEIRLYKSLGPGVTTVLDQLSDLAAATMPGGAADESKRGIPFWITVDNGVVTRIEEQIVPPEGALITSPEDVPCG